MNKQVLKYYNDEVEKQFEKIIKNDGFYGDLSNLFDYYGIKIPYLYQINKKDNEITLIINDGKEMNIYNSIIIKFNLLSTNLLDVSSSNHDYHDIYDLNINDCFNNCKRGVFTNYDNNTTFTKQYYFNNEESFKTVKDNEECEFYNYHFSNNILDANIRISFKEKYRYMNNFNEKVLIDDIIKKGHNINNINELYIFINERIGTPKFQLYIDNVNSNEPEELIEFLKIENGYLVSSLIRYKQDGNNFVARFKNNKMNITKIEDEKKSRR